jgi:hypothetical protein
MRNWQLVCGAAAAMLGSGAMAATAEWRVADVAANGFTFMNMSTVARSGRVVRFSTWAIKTRKAENGVDNWKVTSIADCEKLSYRDERIDYYAGNSFVERAEAEPERLAEPDTMAFSKVAVACGHRPASNEIVADPYALVQEHVRRSF